MIAYRFPSKRNYFFLLILFLAAVMVGLGSVYVFWRARLLTIGLEAYVTIGLGLVGLFLVFFLLYLMIAFARLHYVVTDEAIVIYAGLLHYAIALEGIKVVKHRSQAPSSTVQSIRFWPCFPMTRDPLVVVQEKIAIWLSPVSPVRFSSTLYRVLKLREQEVETRMPKATQPISSTYPYKRLIQCLVDSRVMILSALNVGLWILFGGLVFWVVSMLPHFTTLKYSLTFGIQTDGQREAIVWVWAAATFLLVALIGIALAVFRRERIAAYLSLGSYPFLLFMWAIYLYGLVRFDT